MRFILQYMLYYDIKQSVEFCLCVYVRYIAVNRFLIRNGCELQNHTGSSVPEYEYFFRTNNMSYTPSPSAVSQIPLIMEVYEDEDLLLRSPDTEWYGILKNPPWQDYCETAALYYDALYHFSKSRRESAGSSEPGNNGDRETAEQRLLFNRPTMDKTVPVLYEPEFQDIPVRMTSPLSAGPGIVPQRPGGPKPECFFAMFAAFLGVNLMGFEPEPETVRSLLTSNPTFAGICGFIRVSEFRHFSFFQPGLYCFLLKNLIVSCDN